MLSELRRRVGLLLLLCVLASCSGFSVGQAPVTPTPPATATIVATAIPATATIAPPPTATVAPLPATLQVRVIQSDNNSPQPLIDVLTQTAALQQLPITVDARSPDGTYALASTATDSVDVWIGNE